MTPPPPPPPKLEVVLTFGVLCVTWPLNYSFILELGAHAALFEPAELVKPLSLGKRSGLLFNP